MHFSKCPRILEIHPGKYCQLSCNFCYRQGNNYGVGLKLLSLDCLKKAIYAFTAYGGIELYISGGCEPFSRLIAVVQAIRWARKVGLKVRVYTNGVSKVLTRETIRKLLAFETEQVRFSIHAIEQHTYEKITGETSGQINLKQVVDNVQGILAARGAGAGSSVGIGFVAQSQNIDEVVNAAKFWHKIGVDFFDLRFDSINNSNTNVELMKEVNKLHELVNLGYFNPMQVSIGIYTSDKPGFASKCYAPLEKLIIDPFGLVWCCCLLAQPGYRHEWAKVGDISTESFCNIIQRVENKFPRQHCDKCTPWEASYNLNREQYTKKRLNAPRSGRAELVINESTKKYRVLTRM